MGMSQYPSQPTATVSSEGLHRPPRPAVRRRPRLPAWGWLEWFVLSQTLVMVPLFIPGLSAIRIVTRVAAFGLALVAWSVIRLTQPRTATSHPAALWLVVTMGWLGL